MNNPETQAKNPGEQPQQASQWDSLSDHGKEIKEEKAMLNARAVQI